MVHDVIVCIAQLYLWLDALVREFQLHKSTSLRQVLKKTFLNLCCTPSVLSRTRKVHCNPLPNVGESVVIQHKC